MIENILKYYSNRGKKIYFEHVNSEELLKFAASLQRLKQECEQTYDNDEHLLEVLNLLNNILFKLCGSFLPFSQVIDEQLKKELLKKLDHIKLGYPNLFEDFIRPTGKTMYALLQTDDNKLRNYICDYINNKSAYKEKVAIITKRALSNEEKSMISKGLRHNLKISYYTENGFRKTTMFYKIAIFIGNVSYYSNYAFNTLKADNTFFIAYNIFPLRKPSFNSFSYIPETEMKNTIFIDISFPNTKESVSSFEVKADISIETFVNKLVEKQSNELEAGNMQPVEASVVFLENDRFIFVSRESKVRVFSPIDKSNLVKQLSFKDLEEDDFIIIRNERDTKLIAEVADQEILKDEAETFRRLQELWKKRLRTNTQKKGVRQVSEILLKKYKVTTASPVSVRNWCNDDSICPTELPKILYALKFDDIASEEICNAMKRIQLAHRNAGRIISIKLMKELNSNIYNELLEKGYFTFESTEFNGASFNIERIIAIDNEKRLIMPYNLMKPFSMND